jgi:hypothetical protein
VVAIDDLGGWLESAGLETVAIEQSGAIAVISARDR